jgi:hypothetical protein
LGDDPPDFSGRWYHSTDSNGGFVQRGLIEESSPEENSNPRWLLLSAIKISKNIHIPVKEPSNSINHPRFIKEKQPNRVFTSAVFTWNLEAPSKYPK